jgi:hypothetical protein
VAFEKLAETGINAPDPERAPVSPCRYNRAAARIHGQRVFFLIDCLPRLVVYLRLKGTIPGRRKNARVPARNAKAEKRMRTPNGKIEQTNLKK